MTETRSPRGESHPPAQGSPPEHPVRAHDADADLLAGSGPGRPARPLRADPPPHLVRRGEGMPLIAVHGNGVDHRLLLALDDCFAAPGRWERIYLDLPGFGATPPPAGSGGLPELADWLDAVITDLVGEAPFALLANSLGGLLAREIVARRPDQVQGLALIAPVVDPIGTARRRPPRTVTDRDEDLLDALAPEDREEFEGIAVRQTPASWRRFRDHALPGVRAADPDAMGRLAQRYRLPRVPEAESAPYEGPTLILTGRQDHVVGFEDQFALLPHYPGATYLALDSAGHNVHLEQPEASRTALQEWAERVGPPERSGAPPLR